MIQRAVFLEGRQNGLGRIKESEGYADVGDVDTPRLL